MTYQTLEVDQRDDGAPVTILTLNRPGEANALNTQMCREIQTALAESAADGVKSVVIRANGKVFSAGVDIKDAAQLVAAGQAEDLIRGILDMEWAVATYPGAVVSVVHGAAVGAGAEIVIASDSIVATDRLRLSLPEIPMGAMTGIATVLLPRLVGEARGRRLLLSGERVGAATLRDWGVIATLYDEDAVLEPAVADARAQGVGEPEMLGLVKQQWLSAVAPFEQVVEKVAPRFARIVENLQSEI